MRKHKQFRFDKISCYAFSLNSRGQLTKQKVVCLTFCFLCLCLFAWVYLSNSEAKFLLVLLWRRWIRGKDPKKYEKKSICFLKDEINNKKKETNVTKNKKI